MRGGKYYFSVSKAGPSPKSDHKSPNSQSKKSDSGERKKLRRQNNFKTDDWYKKATLAMAIAIKQ